LVLYIEQKKIIEKTIYINAQIGVPVVVMNTAKIINGESCT